MILDFRFLKSKSYLYLTQYIFDIIEKKHSLTNKTGSNGSDVKKSTGN